MRCPVCFEDAALRADGTVGPHDDGLGKVCVAVGRLLVPWNERTTTNAVHNRACGRCEVCFEALHGAGERHHRMSRGVGGTWTPGNIILICSKDHRWITEHPDMSYQLGLMLHGYDDPETTPVTCRDGTVFQPSSDVTQGGRL